MTLDLLSCLDSEGHSALDWAADAGDVNLLEFLIKAGLNPYRVDSCNRGPLFWAVKNGKYALIQNAALFSASVVHMLFNMLGLSHHSP